MFDEGFNELVDTLFGVFQNICELVMQSHNGIFRQGSFVVFLIADGMEKVSTELINSLRQHFRFKIPRDLRELEPVAERLPKDFKL